MNRVRLTMAQALIRFLDCQYVELDGAGNKFVRQMFGVFGHGCVVGVGQALEQGGHSIRFLQGKNEQNMALAAVAFAKQKNRREIIPCVSSIGPGAMNMVTAAACATANRIPLLVLPGDTFACRQPDPVLQQAEFFDGFGRTVTDAFRGVCRYFDRLERPEQLMTAAIHALRVLTDPADTGAVCLALPQDVEGEAYDYPETFFQKRVWHMDRRDMSASQLDRALALISEHFNPKQRVFLDFVLSHYVALGVEELDQAKLTPLLKLKYHDSIPDAVADLGRPDEIGKVFNGFQRYLYAEPAALC